MKYLNTFTRKARGVAAAIGASAMFAANPAFAAGGLDKARGILETLKEEATTIIPIAATLILMILAIGYAARMMEKDTFVRWAIGVIIAGSAAQITAMLFT